MIGSKRADSKTTSLGALAELAGKLQNPVLRVGTGASGKPNWNALEEAKKFEAARQRFDVEKYRVMLRRY